MKKIVSALAIGVVACSVAAFGLARTPVHAAGMNIMVVSVADMTQLQSLSSAGWTVRAGVSCPPAPAAAVGNGANPNGAIGNGANPDGAIGNGANPNGAVGNGRPALTPRPRFGLIACVVLQR